jgi:RNA polymerase sigma factor (sigma-70 family)
VVKWSVASRADPRAFLVRVTTRQAIDRLRRAKARRESYIGPWLPEPILTRQDISEDAAMAESVSMAMLVVLETLSPLERAVFVLREAFGIPHSEIADVLGRKEEAVRQLARRAREHVRERRSRFEADQSEQRRVTERFLEATSTGDLEGLMAILTPGVTLVADSGGKALAPRRPVHGAEKVARFLLAVATEERTARFLESVGAEPSGELRVHLAQVNVSPRGLDTFRVLDANRGASGVRRPRARQLPRSRALRALPTLRQEHRPLRLATGPKGGATAPSPRAGPPVGFAAHAIPRKVGL